MPLCRLLIAALVLAAVNAGANQGVVIRPDEDSNFVYSDDFSTPRCLVDAFLVNTSVEVWQPGSLQTQGPARNRTVVYRFHGDRTITRCSVKIEQQANARHLGGQTWLYLSRNGLDWKLMGDSATQKADPNGWQSQPLEVSEQGAMTFVGGSEIWLKLVLDNHSGLKTHVSNIVQGLDVRISLGQPASAGSDPQASLKRDWAQWRRRLGWSAIALDAADPIDQRAPHYYEDADGWLRAPGETGHLGTAEHDGFRVQRVYRHQDRSPLSLAAFVKVTGKTDALVARVSVLATRDGSRRMQVKWDGRVMAEFDAASFLPEQKVFLTRLAPCAPGKHELRIAPADQGAVMVREIALVGPPGITWDDKPQLARMPALQVLSAQYLPDPEPPADSQVVEGRQATDVNAPVFAGLQRFYKEHDQFGALRVIVRNAGQGTVRMGDGLLLNGAPLADSYVDFVKSDWDARGVIWHRLRPQTLGPGECGELYVRFRKRPTGQAARIAVPCENAPTLQVQVPYRAPSLVVDYVTPSHSGAELYVYLRRLGQKSPGVLKSVALDGKALANGRVYGGDFGDGVALVIAPLSRSLAPLSFHAITAQTDAGQTAGAQFRVLPWMFPRSSIHVPSELCAEMNMNLGMWHFRSLEDCLKHGIPTTTNTDRMFDAHQQVRFILGPDEPDAGDNRGGGYDRGLGSHARRLAESGWADLVASQAPHVATWVIMNGTTRPLNWNVYGQLADVSCFDPYPINFYGADHAYVRESLSYARQCGMPRRMYACLEAFGWSAGQGVPTNRRGPEPEEWRQNVVQALGSGAKGLTSWVYSAGAGGWQLNEPVKQEMARVNALISRVEDLLLLGTPVDWASTDAGTVRTGVVGDERWPKERVWAGALLCGPDAMVVTVANHIPASKPGPPQIEAARNVTVNVRLPEYLRDVSAVEVTEDGEREIPCQVVEGQARLRLESIRSGRVFVLKRR